MRNVNSLVGQLRKDLVVSGKEDDIETNVQEMKLCTDDLHNFCSSSNVSSVTE
jgi:hypothetical protein